MAPFVLIDQTQLVTSFSRKEANPRYKAELIMEEEDSTEKEEGSIKSKEEEGKLDTASLVNILQKHRNLPPSV